MNSVLYCLHNLSQKSHLRRMEKFLLSTVTLRAFCIRLRLRITVLKLPSFFRYKIQKA